MDDLTDRVRRAHAGRPAPDSVDTDVLLERVHAGAQRRIQRRRGIVAGAAGVAALVVVGTVGSGILAGGGLSTSPTGGDAGSAVQDDPQLSAREEADSDSGAAEADERQGRPEAAMDTGVPPNLSATSLTAVSPDTFWVLGSADGAPTLARTDDGGQSFHAVDLPSSSTDLSLESEAGGGPVVRFADENNGWFADGQLWSTHDGGRSWDPADGPDSRVHQLEASGGFAYALTDDGQLWRSSTDADSWRALDVDLTAPEDLAVTNDLVVVTDRTETATKVVVSGTAGESFDEHRTPCAPELSPGQLSAASDDGLWLACPTGMASRVLRSDDGGQTWDPVSSDGKALPNSALIAARDVEHAIAAFNGTAVDLGEAASATDTAARGGVPGLAQPTFAGFTTPEVGYLIDTEGAVFRTTDGGTSWTEVEFG